MGRRHHKKGRHFKKHHQHYHDSDKCAYCGNSFNGLPHKCKFCGQFHCNNHIIPENHECKGLKRPDKWQIRENNFTNNRSWRNRSSYTSSYIDEDKPHYNPHGNYRNKFRMPRLRLPRVNRFFGALIIAVLSYFLAVYLRSPLTLWIEGFAWIYFAFVLYRGAFHWANRVNMANDLSFFGLRILGGILIVVGVYVMFAVMLASVLVRGSAPISIPLFILLGGLILLSVFIAFKTNRRHHVVGFWRA